MSKNTSWKGFNPEKFSKKALEFEKAFEVSYCWNCRKDTETLISQITGRQYCVECGKNK